MLHIAVFIVGDPGVSHSQTGLGLTEYNFHSFVSIKYFQFTKKKSKTLVRKLKSCYEHIQYHMYRNCITFTTLVRFLLKVFMT